MTPIFPQPTDPSAMGFTLMELLVVLSIVGLLAAVAVPTMFGKSSYAEKARVIAEVTQQIDEATAQARSTGQAVRLELPKEANRTLRFLPAIGEDKAPIFFADGSSNGGVIALGDAKLVEISWLDSGVARASN